MLFLARLRIKIRVVKRANGRNVSPTAASTKESWDLNLPATQMDNDTDDDVKFSMPHRPESNEGGRVQNTGIRTRRENLPTRELDNAMEDSSQNLLPMCLSRLRIWWMQWSWFCTRFHDIRGRWLRVHWQTDSQLWHQETQRAEQLAHDWTSKIASIPIGAEIPTTVRQQRWSPLNVPLIWGTNTAETNPVMDWLVATTIPIEMPLEFNERSILQDMKFSEKTDAWLRESRTRHASPLGVQVYLMVHMNRQ